METDALLLILTSERVLCLLFSAGVLGMLFYLLFKLEGAAATHLWFPLLKMVVMLSAIVQSILLLLLSYSRVSFLTALLMISLMVLILRPDYVHRSPSIFVLTFLGITIFPIVDYYARPDWMVGLAFTFLLVSSVVEYRSASWFFVHKTAEVRLPQVSVLVETQGFKFICVSLYAIALLGWYLGWSVVGWGAMLVFVLYASFLIWLCCLCPDRLFQPVPMERLRRVILKNFGVEILLGMEKDTGGQGIYQRLCYYFEKEKPYLNPDLTTTEVARALFTNKVYLGKAIKHYTQLNFPRFVNRYRVQHAQKLLKDKPNLKMTQVFMMSGFKTKATFEAAFQLEIGESPKEWCNYMLTKKK